MIFTCRTIDQYAILSEDCIRNFWTFDNYILCLTLHKLYCIVGIDQMTQKIGLEKF